MKNCCTFLILKNPTGSSINNIILSIRNAEITKEATLLGSDDKQNWFALKQHFYISSIGSKNETSEIKIVDFPLSNYSYYQLQLQDSTSAPVNILHAGYYEASTENGKYTEIGNVKSSMSDSTRLKKSYIHISFDTAIVLDKLKLSLSGAPYYLRKGALYLQREEPNKRGDIEVHYDLQCMFEVSSKQSSLIELPGIKAKHLQVVIENEDNPVLDVVNIRAYQLNRYLVAYLKRGEQYSLRMGDVNLKAPSYDLAYFKDNIPGGAKLLEVGAIKVYKEKEENAMHPFFTNRYIIWLAIVLVIIVLVFMSVRLIKETSTVKK